MTCKGTRIEVVFGYTYMYFNLPAAVSTYVYILVCLDVFILFSKRFHTNIFLMHFSACLMTAGFRNNSVCVLHTLPASLIFVLISTFFTRESKTLAQSENVLHVMNKIITVSESIRSKHVSVKLYV